jgi:cytosine/adenosine deaminase-related metal-dependent hydrolase
MRHGGLLDSFDRYRALDINLALGTDTVPPDMIRVMDYGSLAGKIVAHDQTATSAADLFRAATLGGATALGRDDLGRLAPGAKADITVVSLASLRSGPFDDPVRTMLYNTTGADVSTVVVNGRTILEDGSIPGIDVDELRERAQRYFDVYRASYTERDFRGRATDDLFPPSFPIVQRP